VTRSGTAAATHLDVEGRRVRVTNLDKVLWPAVGMTKAGLLDYYLRVAPVLLAHLAGRPVTLHRFPDGVEGSHWFETRCPPHPPWVRTQVMYPFRSAKDVRSPVIDDLPTLVWAANTGAIELHPYLGTTADLLCPTVVVFDLDPGPPAGMAECCQVALVLKGLFDQLGLESFAKTSGSKGMQLYVPVNGDGVDADLAKGFARAVAETLEQGMPDLVVSRMTKAIRGGKVLVDWSQNDDHKTTVCVYSLRAKDRPTVSTPVTWEEVAGDPAKLSFEAHEVIERVERVGDLFAPVVTLHQELPVGTTA